MPGPETSTAPAGLQPVGWDVVIDKIAKQNNVNPALARAVAMKESSLNPWAAGDVDPTTGKPLAIGLFQLHEAAAQDVGLSPEDRKIPIKNVIGGVQYLKRLSDRYNGDVTKALQAYNGGSKYVDDGQVSPAAQAYAAEVLGNFSSNVRKSTTANPNKGPATPLQPNGTPEPMGMWPNAANAKSLGHEMAVAYDPRTQTGRENLAVTGATAAATYATSGLGAGILPTLLRVLGPAAAAATVGGGSVATEQALGTGGADKSVLGEAAFQGATDLAGQAFMWPIRAVGRRVFASKVANEAAEGIRAEGIALRDQGHAAIQQVKSNVNAAVNLVRKTYQSTIDSLSDAGTAAVRATRKTAAQDLADVELKNAAMLASTRQAMDDLLAQAPSVFGTAATVKGAVEGPVKRAFDIAGQQVRLAADDATARGLQVDLAPVQKDLARMASEIRPSSIFPANKGNNPIGFTPEVVRLRETFRRAATAAGATGAQAMEDANIGVARMFGIPVEQMNPKLPGAIGRLLTAEGPVTFTEAHQIKKVLDDAVNWKALAPASRKLLAGVTKHTRNLLRDQMRGDQAYDAATATYASMAPLYYNGVGAKMVKLSNTPAGSAQVANLLKENDPISAKAVRDLLLTWSHAGGDIQAGRAAWNNVRASYTYDHLIAPGIDKLSSNLDTLATQHPEFTREVFHDMSGRQILLNLGNIADAFTKAEAEAAAAVAASKAAGTAAVTAAGDVASKATRSATRARTGAVASAKASGDLQIEAARTAATTAKDQHAALGRKFAESSTGKFAGRTWEDTGVDAVKAAALGLGSKWGLLSAFRLLRTPAGKDMLEWAAYSNANTERLIHVLQNGPKGGVLGASLPTAISALIRDAATATRAYNSQPQQPTP